ncbi:hypothetical protein Q2Y29_003015 [Vibrio alginolyticus]|nr:hypothetical protein [Vibrio alginolyticus]
MFKMITLPVIALMSMSANSADVNLDLTRTQFGISVEATTQSKPVKDLEVKLLNSDVTYKTDEFGRVLLPTTFRTHRNVKVEAIESGEQVALASIYITPER